MLKSFVKIVEEYNKNEKKEEFLPGLNNFIPKQIQIGFKKERNLNDSVLSSFIEELKNIPTINDKKILYDEKFVKQFYRIFWKIISELAIGTQNFYDFIEPIINELNRITVKDYILYDCRSTDKYNCGRAMIEINKSPSKFLIFNTDEKGLMDVNTQLVYSNYKCPEPKIIKIEEIEKYFPKFGKRIVKEISMLSKKYKVKIIEKNPIEILLRDEKNIITFSLPEDYPLSSPSGTFNGRTISEIDIDWDTSKNLLSIINNLIKKKFPKSFPILCEYLLL